MRALVLVLSVVLFVGCRKPNEITNGNGFPNENKNGEIKNVPSEIANSIGMKMVLVHAGSFTMGSTIRVIRVPGLDHDDPKHEVTISKSYYLGVFEVTQDEYEKVMGENLSKFRGKMNPVDNVNWADAVTFCRKLSDLPEEKTAGREYRLPTEAEWEYACRAGSTTEYCFGDAADELEEYAWYSKDQLGRTHAVGLKKPNRWGLYDMHGNLCEWCQDFYEPYTPGAETDPQGPGRGSNRVVRNGCWRERDANCRSAYRSPGGPGVRTDIVGFRVALSPSVK